MRKAIDYFKDFVKINSRYPTLEEWYNMGYKRTSYYLCKQAYQPTQMEEAGYSTRTSTEIYPNGVIIKNLKFKEDL